MQNTCKGKVEAKAVQKTEPSVPEPSVPNDKKVYINKLDPPVCKCMSMDGKVEEAPLEAGPEGFLIAQFAHGVHTTELANVLLIKMAVPKKKSQQVQPRPKPRRRSKERERPSKKKKMKKKQKRKKKKKKMRSVLFCTQFMLGNQQKRRMKKWRSRRTCTR